MPVSTAFLVMSHVAVPATVLVRGEEDAGLLACGFHLVELGDGHSCGLLGDDVLAGRSRLDGHLLVEVVGYREDDGVDVLVSEQLVGALVGDEASLLALGDLDRVDVAHGCDLHACTGRVLRVPLAHAAVADDSQLDVHYVLPSRCLRLLFTSLTCNYIVRFWGVGFLAHASVPSVK